MGYYYDWIERKWLTGEQVKPTAHQRRLRLRRRTLLQELLTEIEQGGDTGLYAGLLARTLVQTDEELMRQLGRQIADITAQDESAKHHQRSDAAQL